MSAREVDRAGVLRRVRAGELKLVSAAQVLGVSYRQAKRLWKRYQEAGDISILVQQNGYDRAERR